MCTQVNCSYSFNLLKFALNPEEEEEDEFVIVHSWNYGSCGINPLTPTVAICVQP